MGERPAARVLPADADAVPLEEDRREREVLGGAPVERLAGHRALAALLEELEGLGVRVEAGGHRRELVERVEQLLLGNAVDASGTAASGPPTYGAQTPPIASGFVWKSPLRASSSARSSVARRSCAIVSASSSRDLTRRDEARDVDLAHRRLLVDERVHERLREARLVALVVAVLAVAVHVDDDVLLEALAELHREARDLDDGLGSSPFTWKTGTRSIRAMSVQ